VFAGEILEGVLNLLRNISFVTSGQIFFLDTEKCKNVSTAGFFSALKVCCLAEEEQNGSEIMCQKYVNQFRVIIRS